MDRVKVCCFCETWGSGGIESFLNNVIGRLDPEKLQIDVVAASLKQSVFTEPLQRRGIRFFQLSGRQRGLVTNQRQFLALLRKERYHVVHLNLYQGLSLAYARTAKRAGVPVRIAHSHNTALRKSTAKPLKLLIHNMGKRIFTRNATQLWACSEEAAKFLFPKEALKRRGYRFIPNGIEVERFHFDSAVREQIRTELGVADRFVIGNVGRLCDQKNQDFLLDVFAQVKRQNPESSLLLVGDGELLGHLKEKTRRLKIADSVIFYGTASHIERLLWAMDVFAIPSLFEGLPLTSIEAQAAGLPVIASEFVPDEAYTTPVFHRISLKAGLEQWANVLLATCKQGNRETYSDELIKAGFDISSVVQQIERCFLSGRMQQKRR